MAYVKYSIDVFVKLAMKKIQWATSKSIIKISANAKYEFSIPFAHPLSLARGFPFPLESNATTDAIFTGSIFILNYWIKKIVCHFELDDVDPDELWIDTTARAKITDTFCLILFRHNSNGFDYFRRQIDDLTG